MKKLTLTALAIVLVLTGCYSIKWPPLTAADYGSSLPKDYKKIIKSEFVTVFANPDSIIYTFEHPFKGHMVDDRLLSRSRPIAGWVVCGTVDNKPYLAAYTGYHKLARPFFVIFKNGRLIHSRIGDPEDKYSLSRINHSIEEVCTRHDVISSDPDKNAPIK